MSAALRLWLAAGPNLRRRVLSIYLFLALINAIAWAAIVVASMRYSLLLGLAPIAFGFGLRHAVDPDHIAAIDNVTRKLMQDGKRPVTVGFYFSLGHSTIVFALAVLIALSASYVRHNLPEMQSAGSVLGTSISALFLLIVAFINLLVLVSVVQTWRRVTRGEKYDDETLDGYLANRGLLARLYRPLLSLVSNSWNMYLVGLLFGLGFDTASEVGILGMSATAGAGGMPVWYILLLPSLFVAGMALVDTTDGVAMLGTYGWAYVRPVRKLYYNMNITLISVLVALLIGGVEAMQVLATETGWTAGPLGWASSVDFGRLGFYIIGLFMLSWALSVLFFRVRGLDRLEERRSHG